MQDIYFGLSLVAILLICRWYIANDGKGQNDGNVGVFAIKRPKAPPEPDASLPWKRQFRRSK